MYIYIYIYTYIHSLFIYSTLDILHYILETSSSVAIIASRQWKAEADRAITRNAIEHIDETTRRLKGAALFGIQMP